MKTMTMVYFKPKPEYFDQFVDALKEGAPNSYVLTRDDEVMEVWLQDRPPVPPAHPLVYNWMHFEIIVYQNERNLLFLNGHPYKDFQIKLHSLNSRL